MQAILARNGFKKVLVGKLEKPESVTDEQWNDMDEKALSIIQLCLFREVLQEVINSNSAADIWSN